MLLWPATPLPLACHRSPGDASTRTMGNIWVCFCFLFLTRQSPRGSPFTDDVDALRSRTVLTVCGSFWDSRPRACKGLLVSFQVNGWVLGFNENPLDSILGAVLKAVYLNGDAQTTNPNPSHPPSQLFLTLNPWWQREIHYRPCQNEWMCLYISVCTESNCLCIYWINVYI
jgi:hypothetical protein